MNAAKPDVTVEGLPFDLLVLDPDGALIASSGRAGPFGAPRLGAPIWERLAPDLQDSLRRALEDAFAQRREVGFEHWDAVEGRWWAVRVSPARPEGAPTAAFVLATDVTRVKEAELGAARREAQTRALLRSIPDRVIRLDRSGRYLAYEGQAGGAAKRSASWIGRHVADVMPPDVAGPLMDHLAAAFETRETQTVEYTLHGSDGRATHYEARVVAVDDKEAVAVTRERPLAPGSPDEPRKTAADVRDVLQHLPDFVLLHRAGEILFVNQACADLLGYTSLESFVGKRVIDFVHPDDREETVARMQQMVQTGQALPPRDMRVLHADGRPVTMELAPVHRIDLEDGPASLVVARDRTQQRRMQERLLATDRMASLGTLASGVAHEISNPLTYVLGNLSAIGEGLDDLETVHGASASLRELQKALADARVGAERVRDLLADLKVFARPDAGARSVLDLRKVVDSAINMAWPEIRRRARLIRDYGDAPAVRAIESSLALAFFHLLSNAAEAIDEGSVETNRVEVGLGVGADGWAEVEIRDSGRGLSEAVKQRMWEPFFSTHARGDGAGLGLPVVQSVLTSVEGRIEVDDRPGGGAIFRVRLPPAVVPERAERATMGGAASAQRYGRVLVVDDEAVIGSLVRRALDGHEVYIMTSGDDALALVEELEFDVVLLDLIMPEVGGIEIYGALRETRPDWLPRIAFITAGAFSAKERAFLEEIPNQVLDKPFGFKELRNAVQRILQTTGRGASAPRRE